jgi:hypothetical protein
VRVEFRIPQFPGDSLFELPGDEVLQPLGFLSFPEIPVVGCFGPSGA